MKTYIKIVLILALAITSSISFAYAEDWFESMERSANDYRGSAGTMMAEANGSRYEPQYTKTELKAVETEAKNINEAVRSVSEELKTASIVSSNTERIAAMDMLREVSVASGPRATTFMDIVSEAGRGAGDTSFVITEVSIQEAGGPMPVPVPAPVTMAPSPAYGERELDANGNVIYEMINGVVVIDNR